MVATVAARLLGLVRQMILGRLFGTTIAMDAFAAANVVTETLYLVVAGGALASAFIPVFSSYLIKNDRAGAWRLASQVANLILLVVAALSALTAIFAWPVVITLLAPNMAPEGQNLTVELLRPMLIATVIFSISGLLMGILNAQQHFFLPAVAPVLYNLGIIFGAIVLSPKMGIHGAAIGVVIGASLHLLVQLPGLRGRGAKYTLGLGLEDRSVREVIRLMGPRVLGLGVTRINFWVNTNLASAFGEGAVSALDYAMRLMLLPLGVFAQAVGIAAFPTFSELAAQGEMEQVRSALASTLRGVLFLALPASAGLLVMRTPIIRLLFEKDEFTAESTTRVAWALAFYAIGLAGHAGLEIVVRAFYAMHDTRTPVIVGSVAMALNVGLSVLLSYLFSVIGSTSIAHGGLALANSLATIFECLWLLWLLRKRLGGIHGGQLLATLLKSGLASVVMGVAIWVWLRIWPHGSLILITSIGIGLGAAVYLLAAMLLKMEELKMVTRALRRRDA